MLFFSVASMPSLGLVLCCIFLAAASEFFQEDESVSFQNNLEEISDKWDCEDIWDAIQEVKRKNRKISGTILISITFDTENVLNYGIFEEPDDLDHVMESTLKIDNVNSVTVAAEALEQYNVELGK